MGQTQKAIKHALTERYYAFEEARRVAVTDHEVNLDAEPGSQAYTPLYSDVSTPGFLRLSFPAERPLGNDDGGRISGEAKRSES